MSTNTNLWIGSVRWWDKEDEVERIEYCIFNATNLTEAVNEVSYEYGEDNIISLKLDPLEEGPRLISSRIAKLFIEGDPQEDE